MRVAVLLVVLLAAVASARMYRTPFGLQSMPPTRVPSGAIVILDRRPRPAVSPRPLGWIADAVYTGNNRALWFGASWTVPALPYSNDGQTLYTFSGIQPTTQSPLVIAQPVLAYQQSPGEGYTLASWFCCTAGHSDPIPASPGDRIFGNISYVNDLWTIVTSNLNTRKSTTLRVKTSEILNQYYVTLETYGITQCTDYPNGNTTFTNLRAVNGNGPVSFQWSIQQQDSTCGEHAVEVNPQEIVIKYNT